MREISQNVSEKFGIEIASVIERIFKASEKLTDDVVEDMLPAMVRRTTYVVVDDAVKAVLPRTAAARRTDDNIATALSSFVRCCACRAIAHSKDFDVHYRTYSMVVHYCTVYCPTYDTVRLYDCTTVRDANSQRLARRMYVSYILYCNLSTTIYCFSSHFNTVKHTSRHRRQTPNMHSRLRSHNLLVKLPYYSTTFTVVRGASVRRPHLFVAVQVIFTQLLNNKTCVHSFVFFFPVSPLQMD